MALLYKTGIIITMHGRSAKFDSDECLEATLRSATAVHLVVIYCLPPSKANRSSDKKFLDESTTYLESHTDTKHLVTVSDFKVYWMYQQIQLPPNCITSWVI